MSPSKRSAQQTIEDVPSSTETVGDGGETHQAAAAGGPALTTQQGVPVADDQNTLRVGDARPGAAGGLPLPREDLPLRPRADPRAGRPRPRLRRPRLLRELRVAGRRHPRRPVPAGRREDPGVRPLLDRRRQQGLADLARDVRGFAVKFYTKEGNWDLVGNNIPVFFIQDAIKFPDLVHAVKQEPDRGFPQAQSAHDNFWDFISLTPESMHMVMWIMSDRAIPRSFRFMEGFGVHTFRLRQRRGQVDVRQVPLEAEARAAVGGVERGGEDQRGRPRLPPPRPVGRDRAAATSPSGSSACSCSTRSSPTSSTSTSSTRPRSSPRSTCRCAASAGWCSTAASTTSSPRPSRSPSAPRTSCPGSTSPTTRCCRAATSRTSTPSSSGSAARTSRHLPINAPKCPVAHFQQDGHMAMRNPTGRVNYEPNSWAGDGAGPREDPAGGFRTFAEPIEAAASGGVRSETFADHYSQARQFYVSQTPIEQKHIADALRVRAEQGRAARHPRADGGPPAQHRRGPRHDGRRRASASTPLPEPPRRPRPTRHRPAAVARAEHRQERPDELRRPQGRRPGHRRRRRRRCSTRCARRSTAEGALVELVAPKIGGVTTRATARSLPGRPEDRRRPVGPLRRRRRPAVGRRRRRCWPRTPPAKDFVADALAHCKFIAYAEAASPARSRGLADARRGLRRARRRRNGADVPRRLPGTALLGPRTQRHHPLATPRRRHHDPHTLQSQWADRPHPPDTMIGTTR